MAVSKYLFAVMRRYGPPYDAHKPLEAQPDWEGSPCLYERSGD